MSLESALALIESVAETRCVFIGEAIEDVYRFVAPLGKPAKENCLAVELLREERYQGGVHAAWGHGKSFCKAMVQPSLEMLHKVRYVDTHYSRKLFEVQELGQVAEISIAQTAEVAALCDFGHGLFRQQFNFACGFLAVSCQANSANHGYNLITKYDRADYIVIDEPEARLAAQMRTAPISDVIRHLAKGRCDKFVITQGRHGATGWDGQRLEWHAAIGPSAPLDTMGAGDAFFAVTAPMARTGSMEDLLLIGNAAGYLKTQILGHRESVTKPALIEFLRAHCPH